MLASLAVTAPTCRVWREVWIFGSYARSAFDVGDVDLAVEFDQTKEEPGIWFATLMAGGFDGRRTPARSR